MDIACAVCKRLCKEAVDKSHYRLIFDEVNGYPLVEVFFLLLEQHDLVVFLHLFQGLFDKRLQPVVFLKGALQLAFSDNNRIDLHVGKPRDIVHRVYIKRVYHGKLQNIENPVHRDDHGIFRHIRRDQLCKVFGYFDLIKIDNRDAELPADGIDDLFFREEAKLDNNLPELIPVFLLLRKGLQKVLVS